MIKEDLGFRQYLYRGKKNVLAQSILAAIDYNIKKLHHKIQGKRTGQFLTSIKTAYFINCQTKAQERVFIYGTPLFVVRYPQADKKNRLFECKRSGQRPDLRRLNKGRRII